MKCEMQQVRGSKFVDSAAPPPHPTSLTQQGITHLLGKVDAVDRLIVLLGQRTIPRPQLTRLALLGSHRLQMDRGAGSGQGCQ